MVSRIADRLGAARGLLFPRDFRLFVLGQSISQVGDQCYLLALAWLVAQRSGSAATLGLVLSAAAVPRALLMPFGGALADRLSHRRLLRFVNLALAALLLALVGLAGAGTAPLWTIALVAVLVGGLEGLLTPAAYSMTPLLVPGKVLAQANALFLGSMLVCGIVGPLAGGWLLQNAGAALAFAIDSASFFAVAGLLTLMRPMPQAPRARATLLDDIRPVAASIRADRELALYVALMLLGNLALAGPLDVGFVAMAQGPLHGGPELLGTAMALFAGGSLLGTLLGGVIGRPARRVAKLFGGILASGLLLALMSLAATTPLFMAIAALLGAGIGLIDVLAQTSIQQRAAPDQLGRVLGATLCAGKLLAPLSTALAGLIAERSVPLLFAAAGGLWVATTLLLALVARRAVQASAGTAVVG